jgi:hypothetical protein
VFFDLNFFLCAALSFSSEWWDDKSLVLRNVAIVGRHASTSAVYGQNEPAVTADGPICLCVSTAHKHVTWNRLMRT